MGKWREERKEKLKKIACKVAALSKDRQHRAKLKKNIKDACKVSGSTIVCAKIGGTIGGFICVHFLGPAGIPLGLVAGTKTGILVGGAVGCVRGVISALKDDLFADVVPTVYDLPSSTKELYHDITSSKTEFFDALLAST